MAIKVNGKLVAGLGKSAYEQAQEGGYTGTEEEFISALANIGSNPTAEGLPVNDVRTGTVRDGQSIAAGDVVNVRALGKTVAIQWNGEPALFRAVQVGNPDPSIYDTSCEGICVMAVDRLINMVCGSNNDYKSSNVHTWCNGDFINGFEPELQEKIKTVKIPYWDGAGTGGSLKNGAEGLSTKGFLPSLDEFGHPSNEARSIGSVLSAFQEGDTPKTISNYFICRNPSASDDIHVGSRFTGNQTSNVSYSATQTLATTPCFILPLDTDLSTIGTVVEDNYDVYRDVVAQKNVENEINKLSTDVIATCNLNANHSVIALGTCGELTVYLIDNNTGKAIGSATPKTGNPVTASVARLDDTHFVVQYIYATTLYARICVVSGTSISYGSQYTIASSVSENTEIITLSDSIALSIYDSSGLKCKVIPISGTTITTSGTEYSISGNTSAIKISATRIPDDDSGNKRVCICFSDTGDGNKGKAVIATVDSANAVTFGEVVTFNEASTTDIHCTYSLDGWVYVLFIDSATQMIAFNPELLTEKTEKKQIAGSIPNLVEICAVGHSVVGIYSSYAQTIYRTGNVLNIGAQYNWNNSYQGLFPSASITENNRFIIAYADGGNSSYGTTTILEISGNRIAGSFLNNSKDAIALESGEGGNTIKLGFGGYCACEGITAGQTIDSEGVTAYSPLDGWLKIIPWQEQEITPDVTGEYTGDGTTKVTIDVGFKPAMVAIYSAYNETSVLAKLSQFVIFPEQTAIRSPFSASASYSISLAWSDTGVTLTGTLNGTTMPNENGKLYKYIAMKKWGAE